jgi:hypothetical protein
MRRSLTAALLAFVTCWSLACDDAGAPPDAGNATLAKDQGLDFATGRVRDPGNFGNSDLFASANGDSGMKLASGGASPTDNRPITWFQTSVGIYTEFPDLASVPSAPAPTTVDHLVHAKSGYGFLLVTAQGDLVRGWLRTASATSVTVDWQRVLAE